MARTPHDGFTDNNGSAANDADVTRLSADGGTVHVPGGEFIADAEMSRDGQDLVLEAPDGSVIVIEGYFTTDPAPLIESPDGGVLTPQLVESFARSPAQFAQTGSMDDESPVGAVDEVSGNATVTHADGTTETLTIGTPIYQGDIIETDAEGAVNIVFIDETSFAVSESARFAIDEYSFDPATESGATNFSVLRGVFVFTSGLIGRDDPDDVQIDTPVGSIGIRGTIIAGKIDPAGESEITVIEGAIVVRNGAAEKTLSLQFETVKLDGFHEDMDEVGVLDAGDVGTKFGSISTVVPSLFSAIGDAAAEEGADTDASEPDSSAVDTEAEVSGNEESVTADDSVSDMLPDMMMDDSGSDGDMQTLGENTDDGDPRGNASGEIESGEVSSSKAGASTGDSIGSVLPPLAINLLGGQVPDTAGEGDIVGRVITTVNYQKVGFLFGNGSHISENGYFILVQDSANSAKILLTSAGETALSNGDPLGGFTVKAFLSSDGRTVSESFNMTVFDPTFLPVLDLNDPDAHGVTHIGDNAGNRIGSSISALGDINGDGFADFIFTGDTTQNHSYIVYGSSSGVPDGTVLSLGGTANLAVVTNSWSGDASEAVVAGIGDFNGDGVEDYLVGQSNNGASGNAFIINGANSSQFIEFSGFSGGIGLGTSVGALGDINNDGYADVIVGTPAGGGSGEGESYIVFGSAVPGWGTPLTGGGIDQTLTGPGGSPILFGTSVSGIGDFNGDGKTDIVIGAPAGASGSGQIYIYSGANIGGGPLMSVTGGGAGHQLGQDVMSIGDFNGDGLSDIIVSSQNINPVTGNMETYLILGSTGSTNFNINALGAGGGKISLSGASGFDFSGSGAAGDFNGDGFDDFAIAVNEGGQTGIYVVLGHGGAVGDLNLTDLKDSAQAFRMSYDGTTSGNDFTIASVGDINGDGYDDLSIGAPDANGGDGEVFVVYGRKAGDTEYGGSNTATANGQALVGETHYYDGGYDNVSMRGGSQDNTFTLSDDMFRNIDGGSGYDAIRYGVDGGTLDFSDFNFEDISQIEALQFSNGTGTSTMTLTVENIFNLLKSSDSGELKIQISGAGAGNLVIDAATDYSDNAAGIVNALNEQAGGGASYAGSTSGYDQFDIGGYTLYIDQTVNTTVV